VVYARRVPEGTTFYLCDFDGTVATDDVGNRFFGRFCADRAAWDALIDEWRAGSVGGREVLRRECALLLADEGEARTFVSGFGVDPAFAGFVRAARTRGGDVAIASDGLLWYLRPILDAHGLDHVAAYANDGRFEGGRFTPRFGSPEGEGCGRCGTCKGAVLARVAPAGARTVFVGDGLSDRCGARAADRVYAKGDLLAFCEREGIAATPFHSFEDVARLEGLTEEVR
jgi:HAD superfamily phosphoserine phosphatase-like hydrolase